MNNLKTKTKTPKFKNMDNRIIESFLSRKIFKSRKAVISAALAALVREQLAKDSENETTASVKEKKVKSRIQKKSIEGSKSVIKALSLLIPKK